MEIYAKNLKLIREKLGLSVAKFANKLEMPAPTLTGYERGERTPSAKLFIQLYQILNVNLNWFITGKGEMFNNTATSEDIITKKVEQILQNKGLIK